MMKKIMGFNKFDTTKVGTIALNCGFRFGPCVYISKKYIDSAPGIIVIIKGDFMAPKL